MESKSTGSFVSGMSIGAASRARFEQLGSMRRGVFAYIRRNPALAVGLAILLMLLVASGVAQLVVDPSEIDPLTARPLQPPTAEYPLGTDKLGRNLFAVIAVGTPMTIQAGFVGGLAAVSMATLLAFVSAYYRGNIDQVIQWIVDVGMTIPSIVILILVALSVKTLTPVQMGLVVAAVSWFRPMRIIRAQVLSLVERPFVEVAQMSGMRGPGIIVFELIPNLLPFLIANLVNAITTIILITIGLSALGLGALNYPTLGTTIYYTILYSAVLQGQWWWWVSPIVVVVLLFTALLLISLGMDEFANPRLRRSV